MDKKLLIEEIENWLIDNKVSGHDLRPSFGPVDSSDYISLPKLFVFLEDLKGRK